MRTEEDVQAELTAVNAAISAVVSGAQSYTMGSRSVTKANLAELRNLRHELTAELDQILSGGCIGHPVGWRGR